MPLDPSFPKDRLAFIVEDAGIEVLVTQDRLADALGDHDAASICIDTRLVGDLHRSRMEILILRSRPRIWRT